MASLTGQQLKDTYDSLLKVDDNGSLGGTYKEITDGLGNGSNLYLGTGGNVGIGTDNPSEKVQIKMSNTGELSFLEAGSSSTAIKSSGSLVFEANPNSNFIFQGFDIGSGTTERMRIDSSGNVGIGATSVNAVGSKKTLHIDDSSGSAIRLSESSTNLAFLSYDSTSFFRLSSSDQIALMTAGSEAMRIDSSGNILPGADDSQDLGSVTKRFDDVYATNGTIQTSDRNEKQDIEELNDAELRVAQQAKTLLRKFRWKSSVEEKGDEARIHFGIIAQDLEQAFTDEGLDAGRYGMFIKSTWTNEDGEEQTRLGVRYNQLLAFIISAL